MGIVGIVGLVIEIVKLLGAIVDMAKKLKTADPEFKATDTLKATNDAIAHYKDTGEMTKLHEVASSLSKRCEGVACPMDLKRD